MDIAAIFIFGLIVLVTHMLEGITGLGATVLALPFAILLFGIGVAVPVLVILALFLSFYILAVSYRNILWKEYAKISLLAGLGLPLGIWGFSALSEKMLKILLAAFMLAVSVRGLYVTMKRPGRGSGVLRRLSPAFLVLGGGMHGAFSSGGPLVIVYATEAIPDKSRFRATLSMVWITMNLILLGQFAARGYVTPEVQRIALCALPFVIAGAVIGNRVHKRVRESTFVKMVYGILLVSGAVMFLEAR